MIDRYFITRYFSVDLYIKGISKRESGGTVICAIFLVASFGYIS